MTEAPRNTILIGDALDHLRQLPDASVDCLVTSPPFYFQRNYGVDGQIGLEDTVESWVEQLRTVMAEVHRVLVPTGSAWVDLGDTYSRHQKYGAPAKSLLLAPQRLTLALVADGWICRNVVIWAKTNPMPASVADRLTGTYDVVLHLVKQGRYYYDLDTIREPHQTGQGRKDTSAGATRPDWQGPLGGSNSGLQRYRPPGISGHLYGKNPGDVWTLPAAQFRGAHYATFPERLIERPIQATCPLRVCIACNQPWTRSPGKTYVLGKREPASPVDRLIRRYPSSWRVLHQPGPLVAGCACQAPTRPGLVLDPFFGTGTVGSVARRLGRDWLGIELNPDYAELAEQRFSRSSPPAQRHAA